MPVDDDFNKEKNAVFVEYDPKIAMEKLLTLKDNQNEAEKYSSAKLSPYNATFFSNHQITIR